MTQAALVDHVAAAVPLSMHQTETVSTQGLQAMRAARPGSVWHCGAVGACRSATACRPQPAHRGDGPEARHTSPGMHCRDRLLHAGARRRRPCRRLRRWCAPHADDVVRGNARHHTPERLPTGEEGTHSPGRIVCTVLSRGYDCCTPWPWSYATIAETTARMGRRAPASQAAVCSAARQATSPPRPAVGETAMAIWPWRSSRRTASGSHRSAATCTASTPAPPAAAARLRTDAMPRSDDAEDRQLCTRFSGLLPFPRPCPGAAAPPCLLTTARASVADGRLGAEEGEPRHARWPWRLRHPLKLNASRRLSSKSLPCSARPRPRGSSARRASPLG